MPSWVLLLFAFIVTLLIFFSGYVCGYKDKDAENKDMKGIEEGNFVSFPDDEFSKRMTGTVIKKGDNFITIRPHNVSPRHTNIIFLKEGVRKYVEKLEGGVNE